LEHGLPKLGIWEKLLGDGFRLRQPSELKQGVIASPFTGSGMLSICTILEDFDREPGPQAFFCSIESYDLLLGDVSKVGICSTGSLDL